jgi:hypothetical protein
VTSSHYRARERDGRRFPIRVTWKVRHDNENDDATQPPDWPGRRLTAQRSGGDARDIRPCADTARVLSRAGAQART